MAAGGGKVPKPKGDGLAMAWKGSSKRGEGAGGGKQPMPKGDGLKVAWMPGDRSKPIEMAAAKKKVR
jgi:hypothetical protein